MIFYLALGSHNSLECHLIEIIFNSCEIYWNYFTTNKIPRKGFEWEI